MRYPSILFCALLGAATPAVAEVSVVIGLPQVQIGVNVPVYPQFVQVPSYPVYYAPQLNANYFFYDGLYWVYQGDNWYASSWYNGPWAAVPRHGVPVYILQVPVRYYRSPPRFFHGWSGSAPPHWGEHWGREWESQRGDWRHGSGPTARSPAPLPSYQRQYSGNRYPPVTQQPQLHDQHYRYQPQEPVVRQYYQQQPAHKAAPQQQGQPSHAQGQPPAQSHPDQGHGQGSDKGSKPGKDNNGQGNGNGKSQGGG